MPLLSPLTDSTLHVIEEWLHHVAHHVQDRRRTHTNTGAPARERNKIWGNTNERSEYIVIPMKIHKDDKNIVRTGGA